MDSYAELKRKYNLRETLIKAQTAEADKWKKRAEELEAQINAIDTYFLSLNWVQKCVARLFRIGF